MSEFLFGVGEVPRGRDNENKKQKTSNIKNNYEKKCVSGDHVNKHEINPLNASAALI